MTADQLRDGDRVLDVDGGFAYRVSKVQVLAIQQVVRFRADSEDPAEPDPEEGWLVVHQWLTVARTVAGER